MSTTEARILVVTNSSSDAEMICDLLSGTYPNTSLLTAVDRLTNDFDRVRPQVLVLAFKSVADSERHYENLFRTNTNAIPASYRTVLLCSKEETAKAYALCKKDYFDDYVMFWPLVYDSTRLAMAVHLALRAHEHKQTAGLAGRLSSQARRVAELDKQLEHQLSAGAAIANEARRSLADARDKVGAAIQDFSSRLVVDGIDEAVQVHDGERVRAELDRLNDEVVMPPLKSALDANAPMQKWVGDLRDELKTPLDAARQMANKVDEMRRTVLVVEDDEFMRKLLLRVLSAANYTVVAVDSGHGALSALGKRPPDLILMDVNLPDINGIEVTRRLKAIEEYADIPVIMITGKGEKDVIMKSRSVGAIDFVVKPFDRDVLLQKVSRRLGH